MSDIRITTKPFVSTAQQRFAFGTHQPWAERWAAETDFSKLPKRVKRIRSRMGIKGCTCKAVAGDTTAAPAGAQTRPAAGGKGQHVAPGVTRIHGNLCNVHGRYGPCDKGASKKPKGGKGKAPKAAKPKQTPAQRAQARTQEQQANAADVAKQMAANDTGLAPAASKALLALRSGQQPDKAFGDGLVKMGLAEQASDGTYRMTPTGRATVSAMEAGDYQRAIDTISRGADTAAARTGRQAAAAQRRQDVAGKRAAAQMDRTLAQQQRDAKRAAAAAAKKPSGGGGGGKKPAAAAPTKRQARLSGRASGGSLPGAGASVGGNSPKPKPAAPAKQTPEQKRDQARASVRQQMADSDQGLAPGGFDNLMRLGDGVEPDQAGADGLLSMGMAERGSDGVLRLTSAGRAAIAAANRGDAKAAIDAISRGQDRVKKDYTPRRLARLHVRGNAMDAYKAGSPGDYLIVEDRTKPTTWHLQVRTNGKPDHRLMGAAWAALHGGYRGNTYQGPGKGEALSKLRALYASEKMPIPESKEILFTVYKDASGADRWFAVSSTAYRDRDKQIVSTKALDGAVALADASGFRGPLRFWHVPGVELGDCDYQATAQDGRFLIESGTFRSPALAAAVKSHAGEYQMSIGFTHPPDEPDASGVFHHIAIFERSIVPTGRASNPLTHFALVTKESRMLTAEKQAQLEQLLGGNAELLSGLLGSIATTDKAAQDKGVAYKDTAPGDTITINGVVYAPVTVKEAAPEVVETEKAGPMMGGDMMADTETPEEDTAEGGMEEPGDENMLTSAEIAAIAQQTAQVLLDALMPHLGIGQKMDEVKSMLGGMAGSYAKKDAELAEVKETLATVQAQVADLSGEQPRILAGGYRASQSPATITTDDAKLKSAQPAVDPVAASFGAFMNDLGFGQPTLPGV